MKSLSPVRLLATPRTAAYQGPLSMDFPGKSTGVGAIAFSAPVLLPRKSHGQRSLVDYSSWGCKSPDRLREETTTTTTTSFLKRGFPVTWSFSALASFLFLPFPAFQHRAERGALIPNCSPEGPALPSLGSASSAQFLFHSHPTCLSGSPSPQL